MKTKEQRYNELNSSGLIDSIKTLFANRNDISEEYYVLMADYIDSMNKIKDQMLINPTEIAKKMPELVKSIQETDLQGIYGRTDDNRIQIEKSLSYEDKKLYFFHELTHALQTFHENGKEQCGFYDGHDGMFLTEGATQYTAEMLYNVSNGTNLQYREQSGKVRGANNRTTYSPLSEYQYNGNVLDLLAKSMDLPLPQILALAYKKDGRETLKGIYESMEGNQGKFDGLINDLERVYSIDNLLIHGYGQQLQSQTPLNITMQDGTTKFQGNLSTYRELMNKTERELVATYMENHDTEYILQNYNEVAEFLTTTELKSNFLSAIQQLNQELPQNNIININDYRRIQSSEVQQGTTEQYTINEFGEIIRPDGAKNNIKIDDNIPVFTPPSDDKQAEQPTQDKNKLSLKQRIAQLLQKNNLLMNIPFVENFVNKQVNVLPSPQQSEISVQHISSTREDFINQLTGFGKYNNISDKLPSAHRMSDPEKLANMQRKMQQATPSKDNDGR